MNERIFGQLAAKEQNWATLDVVRDIAASNGVTPSQVAYSSVTNRPAITAPIVGAKTLEQLEQNLIAGDLVLGEDDTARLNEVSAPSPNDYPSGPSGVKQRDRYVDSSDQAITELF
jgi:aryl-alcohol dehydrogenase-like predicted oxidoreductase